MANKVDSNRIASGFSWVALERFSVMGVQFVLGIILARLISPTEYGILGILMVFISISEVFVDSGFGNAIIYYNNLEERDLSTAFTFNLSIGCAIYVLLFFLSPLIEHFFALPHLSLYLRVSTLVLIFNSLIVVPTAIIKVRLAFKNLSISNITATTLSGIVGFLLAYIGAGVWALIAQLLSRSLLQAVIITVLCQWLPRHYFNTQSFRKLYKYGIYLFSAGCITKILDEGTQFFIGKVLTPFSLGIYTRAGQFASLPTSALGSIVTSVIFPSLSSIKGNSKQFVRLYQMAIKCQASVTIPLFFFLAMCSEPIIRILITDKWIAVVPIMQILCIGRTLSPIASITEQMLNANGRSDLAFRQQFLKMVVKFSFVVIALPFGLIAVAIADMLYTWLQFFITNACSCSINEYRSMRQLRDIFPFLLSATVASLGGYFICGHLHNDFLKLTLALAFAIPIYSIMVTKLFKRNELKIVGQKLYAIVLSKVWKKAI